VGKPLTGGFLATGEWPASGTGFAVELAELKREPMPLDFTQYLSDRLGLNASTVNELLGVWLRSYEPEADRREREQRTQDLASGVPDSRVEGPADQPSSLARTA
jgi:hypothetical protein